jgi:hypothetical protein
MKVYEDERNVRLIISPDSLQDLEIYKAVKNIALSLSDKVTPEDSSLAYPSLTLENRVAALEKRLA